MAKWSFTRTANLGGRFRLIITNPAARGRPVMYDASVVRGAPTQFDSYSDADPFGDATLQFTLPAVGGFDDLASPEFSDWLCRYANVDLVWVPAVVAGSHYPLYGAEINPLTQRADIVAPYRFYSGPLNAVKVWEGYIANFDWQGSETGDGLQVSCQGALFQADRYLAKPFFPAQPWPLESLIADIFDHGRHPQLRTQPLQTVFPAGWKLKIPKYAKGTATQYQIYGRPGDNWSGYTSRQTGAWDHALTSFVQDQLAVMLTDDRCGVTQGNQWTVQHLRAASGAPGLGSPGRAPVLTVRDRDRAPDFELWYGTPGVVAKLSEDSTQSENVIYGSGTGLDGVSWRNAVINTDGSRTDYLPLAASRDVYPFDQGEKFSFVSEAYTNFGSGFDQPDAVKTANQMLARDRIPGLTGTITLKVDPSADLPRWLVRSGMTVLLKGFRGSGANGVRLHIASTTKNPMSGEVELTVDSRYRDLLTVEEARARTRDPLTPVRLLQVNRTSLVVNDIQAPWDYKAGSGFVPQQSLHFFDAKPTSDVFPYPSWSRAHPPLHYPSWYVKVNASSPRSYDRWTTPVPILTSERDTIQRTEFCCYDINGNVLAIPFHVGIYHTKVTVDAMPHDGSDYSAFRDNAFATIDPATGNKYGPDLQIKYGPQESVIILWGGVFDGTKDRAGFSPGRESAGNNPTGELVDEATWSYDNTGTKDYKLERPARLGQDRSAITVYASFYAEYSQPVYFRGRLFRLNPGQS